MDLDYLNIYYIIYHALKQFPHLRGLQLAHPVTENEKFEISVLIGADYYWHFVGDHVIRGNGPTAVQSKLGYLLSGPIPSATHVSTTLVHLFHVDATSTAATCELEKFWQVESADHPIANNRRSTILEDLH